jgi:hypothetical protein
MYAAPAPGAQFNAPARHLLPDKGAGAPAHTYAPALHTDSRCQHQHTLLGLAACGRRAYSYRYSWLPGLAAGCCRCWLLRLLLAGMGGGLLWIFRLSGISL